MLPESSRLSTKADVNTFITSHEGWKLILEPAWLSFDIDVASSSIEVIGHVAGHVGMLRKSCAPFCFLWIAVVGFEGSNSPARALARQPWLRRIPHDAKDRSS